MFKQAFYIFFTLFQTAYRIHKKGRLKISNGITRCKRHYAGGTGLAGYSHKSLIIHLLHNGFCALQV